MFCGQAPAVSGTLWHQATDPKANPPPPEPTMRQERTVQASIFDIFARHEIGRELKACRSGWMRIARCSAWWRGTWAATAFARLPWAWSPKKSVLQKTISAIRAETWEAINRTLLASARQEKLEEGRVVRLDSTVTAALMHEPSDSSLLWDAVRVMVRLLQEADTLTGGTGRGWRNHRRAAKKRWRAIEFTRSQPKRVQLYRELIKLTRDTLAYLRGAAAELDPACSPAVALWQAKVGHYRPLVEQIIAQTERRGVAG